VNARRVLAGVVASAAILTGACGADPGRTSAVAPRAERRLTAEFASIREAVEAEDRVAARSAVRDLQGSVADLQGAGLVTADRAGRILAAAQLVLDQLSLLPAPSPSPTVATSPTAAPSLTEDSDEVSEGHGSEGDGESSGDESNHGEGQGNGHGNGNAYGHEDD
jgi:hypothetical protein